MSSDNILVIGRWPKAGGFEWRVADVGFSHYSSSYGASDPLITPGDARIIIQEFKSSKVFPDRQAAHKEARRIRKVYRDIQQALEYGTTDCDFDQSWAQLQALAQS
jgi:hypothetical protein